MKIIVKYCYAKQMYLFLLMLILGMGCNDVSGASPDNINYRAEMRNFVISLSAYAHGIQSNFIIIPQNGTALLTTSGEIDDTLENAYINSIHAVGRESMFYGYYNDDEPTSPLDSEELLDLCLLWKENNIEVLSTDYCFTHAKMDSSYLLNEQHGFVSFAADERDLNNIPDYPISPYNMNSNNITNIAEAQNFLYLINSENYSTKADFIQAVSDTNYDLVIMDLYHNDASFTESEITSLKIKANGATRLIVCYMSIGEAEDYRYYWQGDWTTGNPDWLLEENPNWAGNYKVKYWNSEWQNIIYGNNDSYLFNILNAGFDGVYLDIIDGYEYFEEL